MAQAINMDYVYPNYDIRHGCVKDGLIRIKKADLAVEIYLNGQWNPFVVSSDQVKAICTALGYTTSEDVTQMINETLGVVEDQLADI